MRKQVIGLAERLSEITLPGGGKATFETKIEKARRQTDEVLLEDELDGKADSSGANEPIDRELVNMAEAIPEYVVIAAYADVERILIDLAKELGQSMTERRLGSSFIGYLEGVKLITAEASDALMDLYQARTIATHAKGEDRISPGQAIEFLRQSRILQGALQKALARAKARYSDGSKRNPEP